MRTAYYEDTDTTDGNIKVVFFNSDGVKLVRYFDSEYLAWKFANKIMYSKKCQLVYCKGIEMPV